MALFPLFYAGNISYYRAMMEADKVCFEVHEHFPKQTFRSRMEILGPNGRQLLVIPTEKTGQRRLMHDVHISYAEQWQKIHWKSLEAAYRRSPYFEYYEDRFHRLYLEPTALLADFNLRMHRLICELAGFDIPFSLTETYQANVSPDFRSTDFTVPPPESEKYIQVFADRFPFTYNLSILDMLFNVGPATRGMLGGQEPGARSFIP